ncbi:hypothetical protein [Streptomyces zaomyceticus]|uniref:hypothetical protein n=1 Tax=Streptomyces zaomyceticus TaxID=68286 RepID=UPI003414C968
MTRHIIARTGAPAYGDLRFAGPGDEVFVHHRAAERKDWPKLWEAVGTAVVRGAWVFVVNREEST